jgi:hypothetical protein
MTPVIQQSVRFRASPQALFDLCLDSRHHSLSTGAPAHAGQREGKNLLIVRKSCISGGPLTGRSRTAQS